MGLTSENAKKYAEKGSDHHKLWDVLQATYVAFADELILPYVKHCLLHSLNPTLQGYWLYSNTQVTLITLRTLITYFSKK